jgi:hypothetical protein
MTDTRIAGGTDEGTTRRLSIAFVDTKAEDPAASPTDPGVVISTCANCGASMIERKCKLICTCGYFLSCSDYY